MRPSKETRIKLSLANAGERSSNAKLTWNIVKQIRELFANGASHYELSLQFNVDKSTIGRVCRNKAWIV